MIDSGEVKNQAELVKLRSKNYSFSHYIMFLFLYKESNLIILIDQITLSLVFTLQLEPFIPYFKISLYRLFDSFNTLNDIIARSGIRKPDIFLVLLLILLAKTGSSQHSYACFI